MYINMNQCIQASGGKPFKGVIHIGAHHGEEAQDYVNCGVKNVLWVEANPYIMKNLFDQTRKMSLQTEYLNEVLSDVDNEETTLNIANNGQSSSILELGLHAIQYPHIQYVKRLPVKTKRFDTAVQENPTKVDMSKYDFINIDVQGAELKVLKGFGELLKQYPIRAVYTEINFQELYKGCCLVHELDEYLSQFGFKRLITVAPEKTWGDALYARKI